MAVLDALRTDPALRLRPLLRREYDQLIAEGCFEGERIELLRGALVEMAPQYPQHAGRVQRLGELFFELLRGRSAVRIQLPLAIGEHSEPEPDLAIVAPGAYLESHPYTAHLVAEVALSSGPTDLGIKAGIYAEAGVTEYWVLDLPKSCVHVHRKPSPSGYEEVRIVRPGERLTLVAFPGVEVEVETLVG